jgi:hypothetical protein
MGPKNSSCMAKYMGSSQTTTVGSIKYPVPLYDLPEMMVAFFRVLPVRLPV